MLCVPIAAKEELGMTMVSFFQGEGGGRGGGGGYLNRHVVLIAAKAEWNFLVALLSWPLNDTETDMQVQRVVQHGLMLWT